MKKSLSFIVIFVIVVSTAFYIWTAKLAKKKSNDMLSRFKEIESSLGYYADSDRARIDAVEGVYPGTFMKLELTLLIDSLRESYEFRSQVFKDAQYIKDRRIKAGRLLLGIRKYNEWKKNMVDSQMPDTIRYNLDFGVFDEKKWMNYYFESAPREESITYLNFLKNQIIQNN